MFKNIKLTCIKIILKGDELQSYNIVLQLLELSSKCIKIQCWLRFFYTVKRIQTQIVQHISTVVLVGQYKYRFCFIDTWPKDQAL